MEFGYFTLSDNHYDSNTRGANQLVRDITAEALYADELGMNSVWIGEHHFNSLGVLSCPDLVLASIAARTSRVRLAPAVTVCAPQPNPHRRTVGDARPPLGRPRRLCRRPGLRQPRVPALPRRLRRQPEHLRGRNRGRAQAVGRGWTDLPRRQALSNSRTCASRRGRSRTQSPTYIASFSQPSIELAARLDCGLVVAPFAASMNYGGLSQVADPTPTRR